MTFNGKISCLLTVNTYVGLAEELYGHTVERMFLLQWPT